MSKRITKHEPTEADVSLASRTVRAFDLEDPLLKVRGAVEIVRVCEEASEHEAMGHAVNVLLDYFDRLEDAIMGPGYGDRRRKLRGEADSALLAICREAAKQEAVKKLTS